MVSDFVSNVSLPCLSKKNRANRLAKLKQCKLDVRREQWLSQVKNKHCKVDWKGSAETLPFSTKRAGDRSKSLYSLGTKSREEETEAMSIHDSDVETLMNSTGNLGHNDSREALSCGSSSTSSVSCSGNVNGEEEDGCMDNWEDVADALCADDNQCNSVMNCPTKSETRLESTGADQQLMNQGIYQLNLETRHTICGVNRNYRAWTADDAFRPRSLPSLSKQQNICLNSEWHIGHGATTWEQSMSHPSCPICYEDLDVTDSSFFPCSCRFRLCLFCHKRILEADGRCPGCRKHYDTANGNICFTR